MGSRNREVVNRLQETKRQAEKLKSDLEARRSEVEDELEEIWRDCGLKNRLGRFGFQVCRTLQGHRGKVYSLHWGNKEKLVSASQDGKLFIWNANKEVKLLAISLKSAWVMTCAYEQGTQKFVACGGLDNTCSIFTVNNVATPTVSEPTIELTGHEGYLSCCRFLSTDEILTSSGDSNCSLWDVNTAQRKALFSEHAADVMSISLNPDSPQVFGSGSCDGTVRIWDIRKPKPCTHTFYGHDSDVNAVEFFPNSHAISSASDDSTCRMFDMRTRGPLAVFWDRQKTGSCVTSLTHSKSGALLFAGYEDHTAVAWETATSSSRWHELGTSKSKTQGQEGTRSVGHSGRVSCLGINPETYNGLCTGSWDQNLLVWSHGNSSTVHEG